MKTKHHRKARVYGGTSEKRNISRVPDKWHRAYHLLFGAGEPYIIAKRLNEIWIDPNYEVIIRRRK